MPALNTDTSATAQDMAQLIFGSGFNITGATYSGATGSSATYSGGDASNPNVLPADTGVILSTGNVDSFANATGANNQSGGTSTNTTGGNGVSVFDTAAGGSTFDASYLEVTFTPQPGQTSLNIEFRFYSEEYNEYVYSNFNDIALIQLDGVTQLLSVGDGSISVNSINDAGTFTPTNGSEANDPNPGNGQFDGANENLYIDNSTGTHDTEMDGFTVTLSYDIPVVPGTSYTLLIGIADVGDSAWDSSLVIASNTSAGIDEDPIATDDTGIELNGDYEKVVDVLANDSDPTGQALTITEINGISVSANDTITLASGQTVTLNPNGTITIDNDALSYGTNSFSYTVSDIDGNTDSAFVTFDATPVCFTPGAMIDTVRGAVAIEQIKQGDLVITRDNGPKPVRWIGKRTMLAPQKHAPIRFAAGVLGNKTSFALSPQQRVLVRDFRAQLYFGEEEVLVPAQFLVNGVTITQEAPGEVTYLHLLFDRHEIITADGVAAESYHPGQYSLNELESRAREELFTVFPSFGATRVPTGSRRASA